MFSMQNIKATIFNKKISLTWLGLLLICGLLYALVLLPQNHRLEAVENQVNKKQRQYELNLRTGSFEARREALEKLVVAQEQLDQYVIGQDAFSNLTLEIGRLATQNQLKLFSCKEMTGQVFQEIPNCQSIGNHYLKVSFKAGFTQFATFLNQLERHRPVIMLDHFRILRSLQNPMENDISMSLVVLVTQKNLRRPLDEMLKSRLFTRQVISDQSGTPWAKWEALKQQ